MARVAHVEVAIVHWFFLEIIPEESRAKGVPGLKPYYGANLTKSLGARDECLQRVGIHRFGQMIVDPCLP